MPDVKPSPFDFDELVALARDDPRALEEYRQHEVEGILSATSGESRVRLEGLQWQIEQVELRADHPLAACLRTSEMMWRSVIGEGGLIDAINSLSSAATLDDADADSAMVLPFDRTDPEATPP